MFLRGGRHKGDTGRVTETEDVTTYKYRVELRDRKRSAKVHRKHLEAAPEKKQGWLDKWMPF